MNRLSGSFRKGIKAFAAVISAAVLIAFPCVSGACAERSELREEEVAEISVDPTASGDGYSAFLYDNTNGLPTAEANTIAETDEGFIWIGSYSGLIRYDGNTFERVDSTSGIASVVSLFVDSKNRLWVGTNDSGAAVMVDGRFRMYNKNDGLKSLSVRSIVEDGDGNIYLATTHGLAMVGEDLEMKAVDQPQINDEYIRMLRVGSDGVIYGVTMDSAVFTMRDGRITGYYNTRKLGINDVRAILPDPERPGYVYLANKESELYYGQLGMSFSESQAISVSPLSFVNSMELIGGDMLWVCTDNGIGYVRDGQLNLVSNVPMTTSVEHMITDYQGNLWFVSSQQGVMKIVPNQFTDIYEKYSIQSEVVYSTCIYKNMLMIGTKSNGLRILSNGSSVSSLPITEDRTASGRILDGDELITALSSSKIRSIFRDSRNRLWFSTFGEASLLRYDDGEVMRFTMDDGMPSDRIRAVCERSDGSYAVACTGGLVIIRDDKVEEIYDESSGITNTELLTVTEASNGDLIMGTDGDGIYVISSGNVKHYGTDDGLHSDVVMRIKRDVQRDIYWIITSNSIAYMTPDYSITTISRFPYSNNFDLYENSDGEMWVLSSNGIYVVSAEQLIANEEITPVFYGRYDGLPCIATSNSYSELTEDGDLYISGTTGIAKVNIEKPFESVSDLKMAVPYIEADGEYIYPDSSGKFTVPSSAGRVTIYGFVYNYSLVNPQVRYHLSGFDRSSTSLKRSELVPIVYTNLRGGSYEFVMEISDEQGNSSKTLTISIVKKKKFYEKKWFMVLCALAAAMLIGCLVYLYVRMKIKKFRRKEQEQRMLVREIVEAFAKVIDMKDKYTNGHSSRVAEYTSMLAKELGCDSETVGKYYNIALLHDIGKVGVPPEVLNKPGKLTDTEFNIIKSHSALGYNTLKDISIMPELAIGAGAHHERPDGKGYPKGLKGSEIPRVAQIIAVADTFDAMYSDRPYRKRMNFDKVVSIMKEVSGTQLSSDVVDAFLRLVDKGEFRAPDDDGGGTTEDIDNIRKKFDKKAGN